MSEQNRVSDERIKGLIDDLEFIVQRYPNPYSDILYALAELKTLRESHEWISVEERMPEYNTDVLLWSPNWKHVFFGYWRHSEEWIGRISAESSEELPDTNPSHWMPLPNPP